LLTALGSLSFFLEISYPKITGTPMPLRNFRISAILTSIPFEFNSVFSSSYVKDGSLEVIYSCLSISMARGSTIGAVGWASPVAKRRLRKMSFVPSMTKLL